MNPLPNAFYIAGGTVPGDAPSYVIRQADDDLYQSLTQCAFCYVLTARQMGKSSLMVRTVARLRATTSPRCQTVVLDLSAMGRNLTIEQWYTGLRDRIGQQLDLEDEMEDFWGTHRHLSPMQRFFAAIEQVALSYLTPRPPSLSARTSLREGGDNNESVDSPFPVSAANESGKGAGGLGNLVIFIDEIDFVRSLPFDTDEFFAAIRACYNQRATNSVLERLTFCLLGVASPVELIQNDRVTPFNIGRRIELHDFTPSEARVLAWGLHADEAVARRLLSRVLYWTGGHPYLTQKLCQSLVSAGAATEAEVDRICAELFLQSEARMGESNLVFVANRFLNSGQDVATLLDLYRKVWKGQPVLDNETSQLISVLKICGIVRVEQGRLRVRNRIYARVFDGEWIREHTPDVERRRQRGAYRRGLLRAGLVGGAALLLVGSLAFYAMQQTRRADETRRRLQATLSSIYESDMATAQREWALGNPRLVAQIVDRYQGNWNDHNPPPFLWRYLWGLVHQDIATLKAHTAPVSSVAFSPRGNWLASAGADQTVVLWDAATHKVVWKSPPLWSGAACVAFSPAGNLLVASGSNGREGWVRIWNASDGSVVQTLPPQDCPVWALAFSPDGTALATGCASSEEEKRGKVTLWEVATWRKRTEIAENVGPGRSLAFSPNSAQLATGSQLRKNNAAKLWNATTGALIRTFPPEIDRPIASVAFGPDGSILASTDDRATILWDVASGRKRRFLSGHSGRVSEAAFSKDGKTLASAGWDYTVRLWNPANGKLLRTLRGHEEKVNAVAFSPAGDLLASGGGDNVVRLWEPQATERTVLTVSGNAYSNVRLAPNGKLLALTMADGTLRLWDMARWQQKMAWQRSGVPLYAIGFTPDSRELVVNAGGSSVRLWDIAADQTEFALTLPAAKAFFHALSPNGQMLAFCDMQNRTISLWNVATKASLHAPLTYADRPVAATFSPDNRMLAIALDDPQNRILLLDTGTWEEVRTLMAVNGDPNTGHTNAIAQLAFSPDSRRLASGSSDASVVVWETATGRCLQKIEAHRGTVSAVAFSPGGETLATAGMHDHLVKLWEAGRPRALAVFTGHHNGVTWLHFSEDGRLLVTKDSRSVRFWRAPSFADILKREQGESEAAPAEGLPK